MSSAEDPMLRLVFGRETKKGLKVLGFAGSTCTGKSSLAGKLLEELQRSGLNAELIGQDQFYKEKEHVRTLRNLEEPSIMFYDYDRVDALDGKAMLEAVTKEKTNPELDVLIIEGNMITDLEALFDQIDRTLFLTIDKEVCRERRLLRVYDPPDEKGYFDQIVWPSYEETWSKVSCSSAKKKREITFMSSNQTVELCDVILEFQHAIHDQCALSGSALSGDEALQWISSPSCGANSLFVGTTRDTFDGRKVETLEYEAYEEMALREMAILCKRARKEVDPSILRIFISHRLGFVPVGESSVVIAASAPQRNAAIAATKWLIDELKRTVPIWKKEVYADGTCSWKENAVQHTS